MQELIEDMRLELDNSLLIKINSEKFIPFLEKEKQQMLESSISGSKGNSFEEYYNQTYNNHG